MKSMEECFEEQAKLLQEYECALKQCQAVLEKLAVVQMELVEAMKEEGNNLGIRSE